MLKRIFEQSIPPPAVGKEGELYKTVRTFGRTFELRYGYYEDIDRDNPPDIIYPDFTAEPLYTDEGEPFVTMIQDACKSYRGEQKKTPDTTCADCKYFSRGEEWFGVCKYPMNKINVNINVKNDKENHL